MILTHINHKMPIYKDCTLFEMIAISVAVLVMGGLLLSLFTRLVFGYASIGSGIILCSFVPLSRFFLARLQKLKQGKPYGYYFHLFLKQIAQWSWTRYFWQSPWLMREGRWSVRSIRRTHA